jgi:hypothetical protein
VVVCAVLGHGVPAGAFTYETLAWIKTGRAEIEKEDSAQPDAESAFVAESSPRDNSTK